LIASDDGYLRNPITVDSFTTGPGIRNEIVFDFSPYQGQSVFLLNMTRTAPGSGIIGIGPPEQSTAETFLEFKVGQNTVSPIGIVPTFPAIDTFAYDNQTPTRTKNLMGVNGFGAFVPFSINGSQFVLDSLTDTIPLNATEKWIIRNQTAVAHPFHIHDIHFFVIAVDSMVTGGTVPLPIPAEYMGPKDNVLVSANHQVTFVTKFTDFGTYIDPDDAYMYHCHILTHEDGYYALGGPPPTTQQRDHFGMMAQFVVWNGLVAAPDAETMVRDMKLFPNPTTGEIQLRGEYNKSSTVRIIDLQGKVLHFEQLGPFHGTKTFDLGGLSKGMYLFEWQSTAGSFTRKVILE
jgi:bilirubin oxidase